VEDYSFMTTPKILPLIRNGQRNSIVLTHEQQVDVIIDELDDDVWRVVWLSNDLMVGPTYHIVKVPVGVGQSIVPEGLEIYTMCGEHVNNDINGWQIYPIHAPTSIKYSDFMQAYCHKCRTWVTENQHITKDWIMRLK